MYVDLKWCHLLINTNKHNYESNYRILKNVRSCIVKLSDGTNDFSDIQKVRVLLSMYEKTLFSSTALTSRVTSQNTKPYLLRQKHKSLSEVLYPKRFPGISPYMGTANDVPCKDRYSCLST